MLVERKEKSHDGKVKVEKVMSQYSKFGMTVKSPRARPAIMLRIDRGGETDPGARIVVVVVVVDAAAAAAIVAGVSSGSDSGAAVDEVQVDEIEWVWIDEMTACRKSLANDARTFLTAAGNPMVRDDASISVVSPTVDAQNNSDIRQTPWSAKMAE
nr:hypothetical protein CFP56_62920 [Quercus suber]